jgi:hypothetical protein
LEVLPEGLLVDLQGVTLKEMIGNHFNLAKLILGDG